MTGPAAPAQGSEALILRELSWRDIPALTALEEEIFGRDAWSAATWWAELAARPQRHYLVAAGGERIVGYAGIDVRGETADLMTMAVVPGGRRRGVAAALLARLVDRAHLAGATSMLLEVRADNAAARTFYRRADFQDVSTRPRYYQPDGVDAVVMRRRLPGSPAAVGGSRGDDDAPR